MNSVVGRRQAALAKLKTTVGLKSSSYSLTARSPRIISTRPQRVWRVRKQEQHAIVDSSSSSLRSNARPRRQKATLASPRSPPETAAVVRQSLREALEEMLRKPRTVPIPRWITPKHSSFTLSELFGHSSFVLVAVAYYVDDFLQLRMITVVGSASMLVFTFFHPHGRVLWLPFKWNCLFIAINSYRIGKTYWNRYQASRLSPELLDLYQSNFYLMDSVDFARLVSISKVETFHQGDVLVKQGERNPYVRLVVDGEFRVLRDGKLTVRHVMRCWGTFCRITPAQVVSLVFDGFRSYTLFLSNAISAVQIGEC